MLQSKSQAPSKKRMPALRVWLLSIAIGVGILATTIPGIIHRGPSTPQRQALAVCRHNINPTACAWRRLNARSRDERR